MHTSILKFNSVTYAIRAQKILERGGIRSYMKKITNTTSNRGCGHGLKITTDAGAALQLLAEEDIRVAEVLAG